ncbi:hypothetical protein ACFC09_21525 [Streptomyces sp. NPDC056161]|uniref:hypothetical protein n=1 Tax=Streptomyces sp. NPDC056161 TaxID=3345732 RepID=UPI0035DE8DCC
MTSLLRSREIEFDTSFTLHPTSDDPSSGLAAYLRLDDFEDHYAISEELFLARQKSTLSFIGSDALVSAFSVYTNDVAWQELREYSGFYVLASVPRLPDPVVIPRAVWRAETREGSWAVQSDGREFLTQGNMEILQWAGIAQSDYCNIGGQVFRWERPPIFGGAIIAFLASEEVIGVSGPPIFLGKIDPP